MLKILVLLVVILALAGGITAQRATAQEPIDIAGDWRVWLTNGGGLGSACLLWLELEGLDLSGGWACSDTGNGMVRGHVSDNRVFEFSVTLSPRKTFTLNGLVSDSGRTFEGIWAFDIEGDDYPAYSAEVREAIRSGPNWGDMNCDYVVNSLDAFYLLTSEREQCLSPTGRFTSPELIRNWWAQGGDANLDGRWDSLDALLILQLDAGLIPRLPVL